MIRGAGRPGTAAAGLEGVVLEAEAQARLEELQRLQRSLTLAAHRARVGVETEVLVAGPSRRGGSQLTGRDPYHRVVNFAAGGDGPPVGEIVAVDLVEATPHSLIGLLPGVDASLKDPLRLVGIVKEDEVPLGMILRQLAEELLERLQHD